MLPPWYEGGCRGLRVSEPCRHESRGVPKATSCAWTFCWTWLPLAAGRKIRPVYFFEGCTQPCGVADRRLASHAARHVQRCPSRASLHRALSTHATATDIAALGHRTISSIDVSTTKDKVLDRRHVHNIVVSGSLLISPSRPDSCQL